MEQNFIKVLQLRDFEQSEGDLMFHFIQVKPNKEFSWAGLFAQGLIRGWAYAPDFRVLKSSNALMSNCV